MKKFISIVSLLALALVVSPASAAIIGTININGDTSPNVGTGVNFSGSCGTTVTGNVTYTLVRNGSVTTVGSASLNGASGNFNSNITVPSTYGSGSATLVATCPNGDTVTTNLDVMTPIGTNLTVTGGPSLGGNIVINGTCGTLSAGSTVNFSVTRNGSTVNLGSGSTIGADGNFQTTVNIPSSFGAGPATITATCPGSGNTITASVNVSDPNATLDIQNDNPTVGGVIRFNGVCGTMAGAGVQIRLVGSSSNVLLGTVITENDGVFQGSLTLPDTVATGNATLQATCAAGNITVTPVTVTPENDTTGSTGGTTTTTTTTGSVGADIGGTGEVGSDITPFGGVEAGDGSVASNYASILVWLMVAIALGSVISYRFSKFAQN